VLILGFFYLFFVLYVLRVRFYINNNNILCQLQGVGDGKVPMANLHIVFLFFSGVMFAISLMSLFGYHCFLISRNRSTLGTP